MLHLLTSWIAGHVHTSIIIHTSRAPACGCVFFTRVSQRQCGVEISREIRLSTLQGNLRLICALKSSCWTQIAVSWDLALRAGLRLRQFPLRPEFSRRRTFQRDWERYMIYHDLHVCHVKVSQTWSRMFEYVEASRFDERMLGYVGLCWFSMVFQ